MNTADSIDKIIILFCFFIGTNGNKNNGSIIPFDKAPVIPHKSSKGISFLYENSFS